MLYAFTGSNVQMQCGANCCPQAGHSISLSRSAKSRREIAFSRFGQIVSMDACTFSRLILRENVAQERVYQGRITNTGNHFPELKSDSFFLSASLTLPSKERVR